MSQPENYTTCRCQHCDEGIEFNAAELSEENSVIPCPHCGLETKLFAPPTAVTTTAKCNYEHCGAPIEVDDSELVELVDENITIPCSKCGLETRFFVDKNALLSSAQDKTKSFAERKADFKNYLETTKPEREVNLRQIEGLLQKHETMAKIHYNQDELELAVDKVIIRKRGWANALASGMNSDRTILISSITAMQLKPAGLLTPGYILFSYAGSKPFMGGVWEATQDPDTFLFGREENNQVADFKAKVEKLMRNLKQTTPVSNSPPALTDEIRKLAELKQQGILSQEEFDAAKRKLLS